MAPDFSTIPTGVIVAPKPFTVDIPEAALEELKALVELSKLPKKTYENTTTDKYHGLTRSWLENAKSYWAHEFDWRGRETHINSFPNYITTVEAEGQEALKIHFVGLFSERRDAVPMVLIHGWPGDWKSFLEFLPLLKMLKGEYTPDTLPYHVIVPSLPGFAFSDAPPLKRDFDLLDAAAIIDKLVIDLGFGGGYVAQGGDVGSKISRILGSKYSSCKAVHVNYCYMPEPDKPLGDVTATDLEDLKRAREFKATGSAYALEQGTRSSTIGLVLSSSPLALLAWVGEKFLEWSDEKPSLDTILESVTLYWLTDTISSSFYNYRQTFKSTNYGAKFVAEHYIPKPFGFSSFAKEIAPVPKAWAATSGDLVFYRRHERGGHFAANETPEVLLKDIKDFVTQVWTA
ncbi:hypothetical protein HYFRA_00010497 [Hymenoscyphus fraxineus]|uniref:Epoxide hydrolase N-terminal domain-containing protein n=1 Tax=Hymenoscyphus fraxineus TaxID=746836 RepID=A0A9N9L4M9_9HELO|nr:hypothetical protein HYFRA_00010497 [Hymenoscyphus fraxineus]